MILYFSMLLAILLVVINVNVIYSDICADIDYGCDACVGNSFGCVWCADEVHNDTTRCRLAENPIVTPSWCQNKMNPSNGVIMSVTTYTAPENEDFVEVKPQHVTIKAQPHTPVEFTMFYEPNLNRPVDIHYIFDNSPTMKIYKEQLDDQLSELNGEFKKFSKDVRFEFADLETKPFDPREYIDDDVNKELQEQNDGFENSGLRIVLEGLSLALENNSMLDDYRKIFILFCDPQNARYVPHPSHPRKIDTIVRKINKIAKRKNVHIIFVGLEDYQKEYKALATKIQGSAYLGLQNMPSEIENKVDFVKVIKDEFMKLVHTLELDMDVTPLYLTIQFKPPCDPIGRRCTRKIQPGKPLSITSSIQILNCPSNFKFKESFEIRPFGSQEKWPVDTDILCHCECSDRVEVKSLKCNSMGDYSCGICNCYDGRYGDFCQCIGEWVDGWRQCRSGPDDYNFSGCDGHGDCICGECHCHEGYSGKHCTNNV